MALNIRLHGNNLRVQFIQCVSIFSLLNRFFKHNFVYRGYDMNLYMVYSNLLSSSFFWLSSTLIIIAGLLPDLFFKALEAINLKFKTIFPGNESMGTKKKRQKLIQTTYL